MCIYELQREYYCVLTKSRICNFAPKELEGENICSTFFDGSFCWIIFQVNGQNVVGMKDKEITKIIDDAGQIVTVTVIPNFLYRHIMKK